MATAIITYTAGENFDHGTLYARRMDTLATTSQAVVAGSNSVTVTAGIQYAFWVEAYNAADEFGAMAGPIFMTIPVTAAGDDFTVKWKTDYDADWLDAGFGADETRIRIPSNRRGHWLQWEISGDAQNKRFELRSYGMEVRMQGPTWQARQ